jgi:hypothetical protein
MMMEKSLDMAQANRTDRTTPTDLHAGLEALFLLLENDRVALFLLLENGLAAHFPFLENDRAALR